MTAQEAFDRSYLGVLRQGRRSCGHIEGGDWACLYRAPDGARCAAGWLVPDGDYAPWMEGKAWSVLIEGDRWPELAPHAGLIMRLQHAHDALDTAGLERSRSDFRTAWRRRAAKVAAEFGLAVPADPKEMLP